jgi:4'-phosphopantetheinyl transferase
VNSPQTIWRPAPERPALERDDVHVWRATTVRPSHVAELARLLTPDESDRANRFHFKKDRDLFISARGLLRTILGRYLHVEPERLRFRYSNFGKPSLVDAGGMPLRFNVAHSGDQMLFAFALAREIGVDVERVRDDFATYEIAAHYFSRQEVATLEALSNDLRVESFFRCWTLKEAYVKARGEGLSLPLDRFTVSVDPREPAALVAVEDTPDEVSRWSLWDLNPCAGYAGALAVEGQGLRLNLWQWSHELDASSQGTA